MKKSLIYSLMAVVSAGIVAGNVSLAATCTTEGNITYCDDVTIYSGNNGSDSFSMGTITITSGDESITILDRNLGATTNDINSGDSYGYYFQWGNNYGFYKDEILSGTEENIIVTEQIIDDNYSWENPYFGEVFFKDSTEKIDWLTGVDVNTGNFKNYDLWGDITNTNISRQGPCPIGYHVPSTGEWNQLVSLGKTMTDNMIDWLLNDMYIPYAYYFSSKVKFAKNFPLFLWTSTPIRGINSVSSWRFRFNGEDIGVASTMRTYAMPVRCFANEPEEFVTLTFSGADTESQLVVSGTTAIEPENPIKEKFSFSGWYNEEGQPFDFSIVLTEDTTIYAKWNKILTLHATGAVIPESEGWTNSEDNQVATGIVEEKYGELPTPIQTGYHFEGWSRLPDEYQEVEYIESHGKEYIDTEYIFGQDKNSRIIFEFSDVDSLNKTSLFGAQNGQNRTYIYYNGDLYLGDGQNRNPCEIGNLYKKHVIKAEWNSKDKKILGYVDNEKKVENYQNGSFSNKSLYILFVNGGTGVSPIKLKMYSFTAYEDEKLVRYFIPAYSGSIDKYGLYDLVSNKFFGNSGDGAFSGGDIVYVENGNTVEENTFDLYAKWSPMYSIQFMSGDNVLQSGYVAHGTIPAYTGDLTYVESGYVYVFSGWNPEIKEATGDMVYTAVFSGILIPVCKVEYLPNTTTSGNVEAILTGCNQEGVTIQSINDVDFAELKDGKVIFSGNGSLTGIIENTAGITGEVLFKVSRIDRSQPAPTPEEPTVSGRSGGGGRRHISNEKSDLDGEVEVDKSLYDSKYSDEMNEAYLFAYENGITTMNPISKADMNGGLTRIAMAKMLSQYAINVLGKAPANLIVPKFVDVTEEMNENYGYGVSLAYQLGIMGINMPENKFRPNDKVTRGEFGTALSRMIYGISDGEEEYYSTHLDKLYEEGVISNKDAKLEELRGYVMLMLMRSAK